MSLLKKLSNVIKEVFWIKSSPVKKSPRRKKLVKKPNKRVVRKELKKVVQKTNQVSKVTKPKAKVIVPKPKVVKAPKISKNKTLQLDPNLVKVGEITHYFERINVSVVKITQGTVLIGDKLTIVGVKNKLVQKVWSMQIESVDVKVAKKGQLIGLKVDKSVSVGDIVYK